MAELTPDDKPALTRREQIEAIRPTIKTDTEILAGAKISHEKVSDTIIDFTKEKAYWFLELTTFRGERPVMDNHVQHLYDEMRKGRFMADHVIMGSAVLDGLEYRINGQHTSWARLEMPANWPCKLRWIKYKVKDMNDLTGLYGLFDVHKGRTKGHLTLVDIIGGGVNDLGPNSVVKRLLPAFQLWQWEDYEARLRKSPRDIGVLVRGEYAGLFKIVTEAAASYQRSARHLWRSPTHAAMFATYDKVLTKAPEFWDAVATGLGMTDNHDPRYVLRETLLNTGLTNKSGKYSRVVNTEELYRICILAWNKWRKSEVVMGSLRPTVRRVNPI